MLDTNTCSFIIREKPLEVLQTLYQKVREGHLIVISAITYTELRFGAIGKKARPKHGLLVDQFVERIDEILPFDKVGVESATRVKKVLSEQGSPIGPNDTLIAGHALATDSVMITDNVKEFGRVPELRVENWIKR